jgi:hypothetical protein
MPALDMALAVNLRQLWRNMRTERKETWSF